MTGYVSGVEAWPLDILIGQAATLPRQTYLSRLSRLLKIIIFHIPGGWGIEDQGPLAGKIVALKSVEFYNADHGVWADHPPMKHRRAEFSMDSTLNHDYNLKHLSAFGGYKSGHLDSVEMFEDEWMYLGRHLQEPKSKVAIVSLPSGLIKENC